MAGGRGDYLFDVTSRRQSTASAPADKGILRIVVCIGAVATMRKFKAARMLAA